MNTSSQSRPPSLWSAAAAAAAKTPEARNRLVDFLRAVSILAVISGHWLLAAPYVAGGELRIGNMLQTHPWTQWLTWGFQVMPIFFLVGGYANAVSWQAAQRDGRSYADWLGARLQRLIGPLLPLLLVWAFLGAAGNQLGVPPEFVRAGSQAALVPIWFLAVYMLVVLLVPLTYAAWQRLGFVSFAVLAALAVLDDVLFFAGQKNAGWFNYLFIWLAVHQLGYAWFAERIASARTRFALGLAGLALLVGLVFGGPYPLSMISVAADEVSNTLPPKLTLLALGIAQTGILLAVEQPLRRWLTRGRVWTTTVLLNGMIMTIYLWHLTAAALVIAIAIMLGNLGLDRVPGSGAWWLARPLWMLLYVAALALLTLFVARYERGSGAPRSVAAWRQVIGTLLVSLGLAILAMSGVGGHGWLGLKAWVLLLPFGGAWLAGLIQADVPWRPHEPRADS